MAAHISVTCPDSPSKLLPSSWDLRPQVQLSHVLVSATRFVLLLEQTHFTVMEYAGHEVELPTEAEFLQQFEKENGAPWSVVDAKVDKLLKVGLGEGG